MKKTYAFLVLLLLAIPFSPFAADPPAEDQIINQQKVAAKNFLDNHKYQEAYDLYMHLLREKPDDDEVNLGVAISAQALKKNFQALSAFERLAAKYPEDLRIRSELAKMYIVVGDAASAKREVDFLRKHNIDITEEDLRQSYEDMQKQQAPLRYRGRIAAGGIYDTNANSGPVSDKLGLFVIPDVKKEPSFGSFASGSIDGSYHVTPGSRWWIVGDAALYDRYNFAKDLPSNNNVLWLRAALGGRYVGARFLAELKFKDEYVSQKNKGENVKSQYINSYGPEGLFTYVLIPQFSLITRLMAEKREYNSGGDRNGWFWTAGETGRYLFGKSAHEALLTFRMMGADTGVKSANYLAWEAELRGYFHVTDKFQVSPHANYKNEDYRAPANVLDTFKRKDKQYQLGMGAFWDFAKDWAVEATYNYTNNDSNSDLYKYDQHLVNMGVAWKF